MPGLSILTRYHRQWDTFLPGG
uniref:Uncharacterized protein n=1 Tax=mine drainage metagenome TaxID=410659 RepID=E6QUM1_9ZZZZ